VDTLRGFNATAAGRHSSRAVPCPRCGNVMTAAVREPLASQLKVRVESASARIVRLAVWRCLTCGVESPRFS
jgi:hypothetical protein